MDAPCIAVLITCHNRRDKTLAALESLEHQRDLPPGTSVRVHLVDSASTDGTAQHVAERFPDVDVTNVGDDVFWGEGMRIASQSSLAPHLPPWTHQLWLNDDVVLADDALAMLLDTDHKVGGDAVVVGPVHSFDRTRTTYSGLRHCGRPRWHPYQHDLVMVEPTGRPEPADTHHGNVVLVPRQVFDHVGHIDRRFRHSMGDYDHGYRVRQAGLRVLVAPRHAGACDDNPPLTGSKEPGIGVREALRRVTSRRELPCRAWWVYCARHMGPYAPVLMFSPYVKTALRAMRSQ
ncbi:glycosyltransferase family 2 protein [Streptomyces sp. NPDC001817]|uniref:glycosyltransferase family 2 protein n=1 Tax=Streptomyces sp. NPDC001817 TaxID=3154398 RepID=UPI003319B25C